MRCEMKLAERREQKLTYSSSWRPKAARFAVNQAHQLLLLSLADLLDTNSPETSASRPTQPFAWRLLRARRCLGSLGQIHSALPAAELTETTTSA